MTWVAAHQSPTGMMARFTHETREAAALMLYTAMARSGASKPLPEMKRLAASDGTDFLAEVDGHWFCLSCPTAPVASRGNDWPTSRAVTSSDKLARAAAPNGALALSGCSDGELPNPSMAAVLPVPLTYDAGE